MAAYQLEVVDENDEKITLASVTFRTYTVDSKGYEVSDSSPNIRAWRGIWGLKGQAMENAVVNSEINSKDFASENDAYQACRKAIYDHFSNSLKKYIRIFLKKGGE
jgi:hypothetical protein